MTKDMEQGKTRHTGGRSGQKREGSALEEEGGWGVGGGIGTARLPNSSSDSPVARYVTLGTFFNLPLLRFLLCKMRPTWCLLGGFIHLTRTNPE